mgnify:CR=1 FL=1
MQAVPQKEHEWLQRLVGEWTMEGECIMGPDQPPSKHKGVEMVRSLGGLWTIGEGQGEGLDGSMVSSVMTLGYDPQKKRYLGTFIASMMTHLWRYEGALHSAGKGPTPHPQSPPFSGRPKLF